MDRYRSYSAADDPSLVESDTGFVGVNDYDDRENLAPGQVQAATNIDFSRRNAETRGGFVCIPSLATPRFGGDWVSRTSAADYNWTAVTYGNGLFVAVNADQSRYVMTSSDAVTWTLVDTSVVGYSWRGIVYGNGKFVAVGGPGSGGVMVSADGLSWSGGGIDLRMFGVVFNAGKFVGVGSGVGGTRAMTSIDGGTWTLQTTPADNDWEAITYGGGLYVATATTGTGDRVMTSPDGVTWTIRASAADYEWTSVAYGLGRFVAVANNGGTSGVMTSEDGITWTLRSVSEAVAWRSVIYSNGVFVAVGSTGTNRVMASRDGINWTVFPAAAANQWWAVTAAAGLFVAVGISGTGDRVMTVPQDIVQGCGRFSDPNVIGEDWVVLAGVASAGFHAFGQTSRYVDYPSGYTISEQATVVQANNQIIIMAGEDQTPIRWDGNWANDFVEMPDSTAGAGFVSIPHSNHATYYVNRLWVKDGKDEVAASDLLDFEEYDDIFQSFNLNVGSSDYVVCTYPFGVESLVVFKNQSIQLLQNVAGSLDDVVATEVTRQVGIIGINAVVSVGPDLVYMSDRNINLLSLTDTNNSVQHKTLPLSRNISRLFSRVNWEYAYKVSMGYYDNKLYVALPLDNSTTCNAVIVYNFLTEQWYGEWTFATSLNMAIIGWSVVNYLGLPRLHCITEDGRIFVTGEGYNDISGPTVAEISTSVTTRAYAMNNNNRINRRMWMDAGTNRPNFSVVAYSEGASASDTILTNQTFLRSQTWIFNDSSYEMDNSNDDFNRAGRKDYATGTGSFASTLATDDGDRFVDSSGDYLGISYESDGIMPGTGFQPEMLQDYRYPLLTRRKGRLIWFKVTNTQGRMVVSSLGSEARAGDRSSLVQVL